jgi:hypothetical protein
MLAVGDSPWEFMGEVILNLTKTLEALFGEQGEDVKRGLRSLGYSEVEIAPFLTVMELRDALDSGHVMLSVMDEAQAHELYVFVHGRESRFRVLLKSSPRRNQERHVQGRRAPRPLPRRQKAEAVRVDSERQRRGRPGGTRRSGRERRSVKLPDLMHATQVARPFHTKGWIYEEKIDRWRMLALKEEGRVKLISRNDREHTKRFGDLVAALAALKPETFRLDGEVAVFDAHFVSRFEWLRHLHHGDLATPPMAFDLLRLGAKDYRAEPLKVRRRALEKLLKGQTLNLPARRLSPNGFAAWAEVLHRGWEGMVAKDPAAPYVGGRTLKWLKVKIPKYREQERGFYKP